MAIVAVERVVKTYGEGRGAYTTNDIETLLGRPPRAFADFARDYADAFR